MAFPQVQALELTGLLVFYFGHVTGDYLWDCILSAASAAGAVDYGRRV